MVSFDLPRHYFVHFYSGSNGGPTKVPTSGTYEGALFGKRIFADIMKKFMMRSSWVRVGPKSKDRFPCPRGEEAGVQRPTGPRRGRPCADGCKDGAGGMQGLLADPQKLRERHGAGPPRRNQPC